VRDKIQITIKEVDHRYNHQVEHRDSQQADKIIHNQLQLNKQLLMEAVKKNIDFQDQKKEKKIMAINHQGL
jgi:hypothetical protein